MAHAKPLELESSLEHPDALRVFVVLLATALLLAIVLLVRTQDSVIVRWPPFATSHMLENATQASLGRDTLVPTLSTRRFTGRLQIVATSPELGPDAAIIAREVVPVVDSAASGRVLLVLEPDRVRPFGGGFARTTTYSIVPSATDGRTCIHVSRASGLERAKPWLQPLKAQQQVWGPCGFIARFGLPSPARQAWLDARGWVPAAKSQSLATHDWYPVLEPLYATPHSPWSDLLYLLSLGLSSTADAERCRARDDQRCVALLFGAGPRGSPAAGDTARDGIPWPLPGVVPFIVREPAQRDHESARARQHLVDHLVLRYGQAKVRQWWTSADTTDAAFHATFGDTPAQFARDVVERAISPRVPFPSLRVSEVLPALLLMTALLARLGRSRVPRSSGR